MDYESVNQYLCAIKQLMGIQRSNHLISLRNDDIMTDRMKLLIREAKYWKNAVTKALFNEQIADNFQPFKMIGEVPKIEN